MSLKRTIKPPNKPFPLHAQYPTKFEQWRIDVYNVVFNRLYPIRPWLFVATYAASHFYFHRQMSIWISSGGEGGSSATPPSIVLSLLAYIPLLRSAGCTLQVVIASLGTASLPVLSLRAILRYFVFKYKGFLSDNPKHPSLVTKLWAICFGALKKFSPTRLESCNAFLPKMPVPDLRDTVNGYLESMEPILPKNEYDLLCEMAHQFVNNEGKKLQFYTRFYNLFTSNYVTSFWERYVYLSARDPLLINSSVGHVDVCRSPPANQAERAAHMSFLTALNMIYFNNHEMKPPGDGLVYTGHYRRMFANSRIPGRYCDHWKPNRYARHLAVYANGCFYKMDLFEEKTNRLYTPEEIAEIYTELLARKDRPTVAESRLAALTHDRRDLWYENRKRFFLKNPINAKALQEIEDCIVFFVMDDQEYFYDPENPELMDHHSSEMLTGNGANRWADKILNFVVSRNGRVGGTSEHSVADGSEYGHIMENCLHVDTHFINYPREILDIESLTNGYRPKRPVKLAERIRFDISEELEAEITRCYNAYQPMKNDLDMVTLVFTDFGKGRIKAGKCSPDAFIQMALQLTNYKDQNKFVLTYEATSARYYKHSRTETLRTVSKESCAFVKAMLDKNSNDAERLRLLRQACNAHALRNRRATTGGGIDRHLFVLYVMSRATNTSSQFLQHYVSQKWLLSTSQPPNVTNQMQEDALPDAAWIGANFAAVAPNGYGVCYRVAGEHSIMLHISSYKSAENTNSTRFRRLLIESFHEMSALFNVEAVNL